jgi:hypothetical protein
MKLLIFGDLPLSLFSFFHQPMQKILRKLLLTVLLSNQISLAAENQKITLTLSSGSYSLEIPAAEQALVIPKQTLEFDGNFFCVLHFSEVPSPSLLKQLEKEGLTIQTYLALKTYTVSLPSKMYMAILKNAKVDGLFTILPEYKMHKELFVALQKKEFPAFAKNQKEEIGITFSAFTLANHKSIVAKLKSKNYLITYQNKNSHRYTVWLAENEITNLLDLPFVSNAELVDEPGKPEYIEDRSSHRGNWMSQDFAWGKQYNGNDVAVMLQDDGMIGPHIDYTGRIREQFITFNNGNHGDHCGGIIMGGGNKDPQTKGMGWGADLYVYEAAPYQGFDSIYDHYITKKIVISSTSYSDGCNAGYTTLAQTLDQQIFDMPDLIHVFSGGNTGTSDCDYGAGAGWGNVTGGHKHSKNSIAVANLDYIDQANSSSSRGPAYDGRLKPEISAVGTNVYSTVNDHTYENKTGTSMSCPGISGTFAGLYQAYKDLNNGSNPLSGLMKAIMMNTADDLGNPGPDFIYGYGRVNARKAITSIEQNNFLIDSLSNGNNNVHSITVPPGTGRLKIMLYWHDVPAAVSAASALVNNLNMTANDPANSIFNPWILNIAPQASSLNANAIRGVDNLNNHEQITIDLPLDGLYTIAINGFNVPIGDQRYFLTWYFEPANELVLTFPNGGEGFKPTDQQTIRWDSFESSSSFNLEYSVDNGTTWASIANSIAPTQRYYNWNIPQALSGQCKVKVSNANNSDTSDENFSIIGITDDIIVLWACEDSLQLIWDSVPGATAYDIFLLGNTYMDSIATAQTDSIVLYNLNALSDTLWFSVRARGANNAIGRRAIAVEKLPGVECPYSIDAATANISSPSGNYTSCMNMSSIPVKVELRNPGLSRIANISVAYSLDGANPVVENYADTIAAFSSVIFTFNTTLIISGQGFHELKVYTNYNLDGNLLNDTTTLAIFVSAGVLVVPPMTESFENFNLCPSTNTCGQINCDLDNGYYNYPNGVSDDIDWRTFQGSTPTDYTGPTVDFLPSTPDGNYLYLEASGGCIGKKAELITPCFDLSPLTTPRLSFAYHMYGADMGSLQVDIFANGNWMNNIFSRTGNQGDEWKTTIIPLSAYSGQTVSFRFRGITGDGPYSDMAIDAISIGHPSSLEEEKVNHKISIFPNPSNGSFTLNSKDKIYPGLLNVYDLSGRLIYTQNIVEQQTTVNLQELASGLYQIEFVNSDTKEYLPIVIR